MKLSDSREMEGLKREEISIIFYRDRCKRDRLIFFARYGCRRNSIFISTCVYVCVLFRIVEKKALERNAGPFIFHRYMEYCNTYIYIYIYSCEYKGVCISRRFHVHE